MIRLNQMQFIRNQCNLMVFLPDDQEEARQSIRCSTPWGGEPLTPGERVCLGRIYGDDEGYWEAYWNG